MRHMRSTAILAAIVAATPALAQDQQSPDFGEVIPLGEWAYSDVAAEGWSASVLLDSDVYGANGEDLGEVEDLIFGPDGEIIAMVAEIGGPIFDLGDTHVSVPWDQVTYEGTGGGAVLTNITEESTEEFDLFENSGLPGSELGEQIAVGVDDREFQRVFRARELIGDYARLTADTDTPINYGYVSDLMIQDGSIAATIVNARGAYGPGYYAYPSYAGYGYGWTPGSPYYDMPYGEADIEGVEPIERAEMD